MKPFRFLLTLALLLVGQCAWAVNLNAPSVYYDLDTDSANRVSAGTHDGSDTNMSYDGTYATFNGASSAISITDHADLRPSTVSISCWINVTAFPASVAFLIDHQSSSPYYGYTLFLQSDTKAYAEAAYNINAADDITAGLSTSTLYHLVFTWDGTNGILYVNGVAGTPVAMGGPMAYTVTQDLKIGRYANASVSYFNGKMRCFGLWNGALTSGQVTQLYNGGTPLKYASLPAPTANKHNQSIIVQ